MGWRRTSTQRAVRWLPLVVPRHFLVPADTHRSRISRRPRPVTTGQHRPHSEPPHAARARGPFKTVTLSNPLWRAELSRERSTTTEEATWLQHQQPSASRPR